MVRNAASRKGGFIDLDGTLIRLSAVNGISKIYRGPMGSTTGLYTYFDVHMNGGDRIKIERGLDFAEGMLYDRNKEVRRLFSELKPFRDQLVEAVIEPPKVSENSSER